MPDWAQYVRPRLSSLRLSPTREQEIVEELSQHLEDRWRELLAGGASEDEATRLALAEFRDGNLLARSMAPLRQARRPPPITPGAPTGHALSDLWQDLRYAWRLSWRRPGFTVVAALTLALGIGANSAIFSLVDAVLLRTLPVSRPEQLVLIEQAMVRGGTGNISRPLFEELREERRVFSGVAAAQDGFTAVRIGEADDREAADEVECQAACADRRRHHRCHRPQIRETSPALAPDLLARSSILTVLRPGQLDQELSESSWLVADIDAEFLFNPPASELWKAAIKRLGANPAQLQQGHGVH